MGIRIKAEYKRFRIPRILSQVLWSHKNQFPGGIEISPLNRDRFSVTLVAGNPRRRPLHEPHTCTASREIHTGSLCRRRPRSFPSRQSPSTSTASYFLLPPFLSSRENPRERTRREGEREREVGARMRNDRGERKRRLRGI